VPKLKRPERPHGERMLKHIDQDGDGQISAAEAADHSPIKDQFATLDKNQDGKLSKEELAGFRHPTRAEMEKMMAEKFRAADKNADGALSQAEAEQAVPHMAKHFAVIDADKNGLVTPEELRAHHQAHGHERRGEHRMKGPRGEERSPKVGSASEKLPPA
jgi:Ca2+-binding EF-hand superfamily protein